MPVKERRKLFRLVSEIRKRREREAAEWPAVAPDEAPSKRASMHEQVQPQCHFHGLETLHTRQENIHITIRDEVKTCLEVPDAGRQSADGVVSADPPAGGAPNKKFWNEFVIVVDKVSKGERKSQRKTEGEEWLRQKRVGDTVG